MHNSPHIITSKHYLVLCVCAFSFGIFIFSNAYQGLLCYAVFLLLLSLAILVGLLIFFKVCRKKSSIHTKRILLPLILILCTLLGIFRIYSLEQVSSVSLRKYTDCEVWLYGIVSSVPKKSSSGYYQSFELDVVQVNNDSSATGTVIIYLPSDRKITVSPGNQICCWTQLSAPSRTDVEDNFDYYTHLRGKNVFLIGKTQNLNPISINRSLKLTSYIRHAGLFIQTKISQGIDLLFPDDTEASAILKGILLGDKSDFNDELYAAFSNAGISYIVAVSGLHISILFSFLTLILSSVRLKRRLTLFLCIPVLFLSTSVFAFSPSVCRAAIMLMIAITATLIRTNYDPVTALFTALGIILIFTPYSLFSKSLILSFFATLGIFAYFKYLNKLILHLIPLYKLSNKNFFVRGVIRTTRFIVSSFSLSLSTLIGTCCFVLVFFGRISKVQFLTNLWTIPLVSFVFCLGYLASIVMLFSPHIASFLFKAPLSMLLSIIKETIHTFGDDRFSFIVPSESLSPLAFPLYIGTALMIYFTLKLLFDIIKTKEKAAEKSAAKQISKNR